MLQKAFIPMKAEELDKANSDVVLMVPTGICQACFDHEEELFFHLNPSKKWEKKFNWSLVSFTKLGNEN